jgi:hypothetical protein
VLAPALHGDLVERKAQQWIQLPGLNLDVRGSAAEAVELVDLRDLPRLDAQLELIGVGVGIS